MSDGEVVFECVVSADLFSRAHLGVSTEETGYYLNGVHVSPAPEGGAIMTATDGSMLISLYDPDAFISGEAIVQLDKSMVRALPVSGVLLEQRLLAVRIFKGGRGRAFVVDQPGDRSDNTFSHHLAAREVLDDPDRRVRAAQFSTLFIDGAYPDWRRILPTKLRADAPLPPFDVQRAARIAKALCAAKEAQIVFTPTGDYPSNSPLLVEAFSKGLREGFGILMPLRHSPRSAELPAWAQRQTSQAT